jgi:hypothetical protein
MADKEEKQIEWLEAEMTRLLGIRARSPEDVQQAAELERLLKVGSKAQRDECVGKVTFYSILAAIIVFVVWAGGITEAWYCAKYQVTPDKLHVDAEPKDCDFMHAPLGIKGCHYEADVNAYNAEGSLVGGDHAPKYGRDSKTGKTIISWDGGKTWEWMMGAIPNTKVTSIVVSWVKVTD